jgi:small-conductance mechanosensitive channel
MTNTQYLIESAKFAVHHVLANHQAAYVNGIALRELHDERKAQFLHTLTQHPAAVPLNISNSSSHIFHHVRSDQFAEFQAIKTALEISEESAEFKEAFAITDPLVQEVRRLEQQLQDERTRAGQALHALNEVEQAARAAAEEKLANDPKVKAAREALAAAQPALVAEKAPDPALIRGKITTRPKLEIEALSAE